MKKNSIKYILQNLIIQESYKGYEDNPYVYVRSFMEELGFKTTLQKVSEHRHNFLAEKGNAKQAILVYIHFDTVPPAENWKSSPFTLRQINDRFLGLGVFDMKGGAAAVLSILKKSIPSNYTLKFAFCIDEEGDSEGVYTLINSDFVKNVVVAFCPEACIIPTNWNLPLMIALGGRGRCSLVVNVPGKSTHGAEDSDGINAIDQAAILLQCLKKWKVKYHYKFGKSSFFVNYIHAENRGLTLPDSVTIEIDYQLIPGQVPQTVEKSLNDFVNSLYEKNILKKTLRENYSIKLKPRKTEYIQPYMVSRKNNYVNLVEKIIKSNFGKIAFEYTKSVADQNVLVTIANIPTITVGPIGGNAHEAEEWVSISSLEEVTKFYKQLFQRL